MRQAILFMIVLVGFAAATQFGELDEHGIPNFDIDQLLGNTEKRQTDGSGEEGSGEEGSGEEGSGEGSKRPHNYCGDFFTLIFKPGFVSVNGINSFVETAKNFTAKVREDSTNAVVAAEAAVNGASSNAEALSSMVSSFGEHMGKHPMQAIETMYSVLGRAVKATVDKGIWGLDDQMKCSKLITRSVEISQEMVNKTNMEKVAILQDPAFQRELVDALKADFVCLKDDVHSVAQDIDNFKKADAKTPSKVLAQGAFGFLYDVGKLKRDQLAMLCTGQAVARGLKMIDKVPAAGTGEGGQGNGSGTGKGGQGNGSGTGKGGQGKGKGRKGKGKGAGPAGNTKKSDMEERRLIKLLMAALDKE